MCWSSNVGHDVFLTLNNTLIDCTQLHRAIYSFVFGLQLCGRGKQVSDHEGNKRLRHIVESSIEQYESCNRQEKSALVRAIVQKIQTASPFGGFVRKDSTTGQWYNIGTSNAHDKVRTLFCALRFGPPTHACQPQFTDICVVFHSTL